MVNLPKFDLPKGDSAFNLGWLLLNDQLSDEALCSILLEKYRGEIERLAAALLPSPAGAAGVVKRTITQAILNRTGYTGEVSGKAWLFAMAICECTDRDAIRVRENDDRAPFEVAAFDPSPYADPHFYSLLQTIEKKQALLLVLYFAHDFPPGEIALLLNQPIEQIQQIFAGIREQLSNHQHSCVLCSSPDGSLAGLELLLRRALHQANPSVDSDEQLQRDWQSAIMAAVSRQKVIFRFQQRKKKILQACLAAFILLGIGWISIFANAGRGTQTDRAAAGIPLARVQKTARPLLIPRPNKPTPSAAALPDTSTQIDSILRLATGSQKTWKTLWADVQISRSPQAEADSIPEQVLRKQIWVSQPTFARVISGLQPGPPSSSYIVRNTNITGQDFQTGQTKASSVSELIPDEDLQKLFVARYMFPAGGTFTLAGSQSVAHRQSWILQWKIPSGLRERYWIDKEYGVILRHQVISGQGSTIILDMTTSAIAFDPPLPPAIFQPGQYRGDHFADNFSGAPEIAELPSRQTALQQSTSILAAGSQPPASERLPIPQNLLSCEIAQTGSQIAYAAPSGKAGDTALSFAKSSASQTVLPALPGGMTTGDYAFAPDGVRLAFFGCDKISSFCGVFILNTHTGRLMRLIALEYADYMLWKPDGRYIALVGMENASAILAAKASDNLLMNEVMELSHDWHFYVIDSSTGKITYKRVFEWSLLGAPPDSPTQSWGAPFKSRLPGPDDCPNPR